MKALALIVVVFSLFTQAETRSPRGLLSVVRPLTDPEIQTILAASRKALAAKTFRLAAVGGSQGPQVLMGRDGQPKMVRWAGEIIGGTVGGVRPGDSASSRPPDTRWRGEFIEIIDYTGRPARRCGESAQQGELVVEYRRDRPGSQWMARARRRDVRDFGGIGIAPIFTMLQGTGSIASGERRRIRGRLARAFISPWTPPPSRSSEPPLLTGDPIPNVVGQPAPNEAVQSLWIDTESLLPLRWETSKRGLFLHGYDFRYAPIVLRPPAGVDSPECIR